MKKFLFLCSVFACLCGLYSCTKDTAPQPVVTACSGVVSFAGTVKRIFVAHCAIAGCHDATTRQNNLDLSTYADAKSSVGNDAICRMQATCGALMPSGGPQLDTVTIDSIISWKNSGYCEGM